MITASHNAADYNGLKVLLGREPLCGLELQEIRSIFEGGSFAPGSGRYEQSGVSKQYLATLRTQLKLRRRMRIGLDAGSSIASGLAEELLRSLGTEITCVRTSRAREDHRRVLDPARETDLRPLQETVIQNGLDLGLAFDSDGDRLGVVGPTGEVIRPDDVLLLFARELLQKHPRAAVVGEVMCSQNLFREIERLGGRPIMSKTGYSLVRRKMVESKALLGGEISGHFFFHNRFHSFSDALYAGGRLLTILAAEERSIVQLLADIPPTIATPRLYFPCADETKAAAMTSIAESLRGLAMRTGGTICEIDGVRIDWEAAWAVARMSNTEPAIVVRCEAADGGLDAIRTAVTGVVRQEVGRYAPPAEEGALRE
jgi:phosphomannomutase/phosphoglucomutase